MTDNHTLDFGVTFDTVVGQAACGLLLTLSSHRDADENPPHSHVNDFICIVLAGGFAELRKDSWRDRCAGSFFVHQAGETHQDRFGPKGAICLNIHLAAGNPLPGKSEGLCSVPARLAADRLAFELTASTREELVMGAIAAEIVAEIWPAKADQSRARPWIDRVVEAISDEPARRWSLRELAAIAQRHPVHVAQAFRAKTGMSLGAFQRRRRLISLSLVLRRDKSALALLASEFGYFDQAHMTSEFRAAFGVTPGRYRRAYH